MESRFENRSSESLKTPDSVKTAQKLKQGSNGSYREEEENDTVRADRIAAAYKYNGKPVFKNGQDVLKFQNEWNKKNPKDRITEDGILGEQTQVRYVEFRKKEAMELVKAREEKDRQADRQAATASITEASRFTPDADRILHYDQSIVLFKKQLDDINAKYQDKTGLIGKAQDWLGETTGGWGSARQIYEDAIKRMEGEARLMYKNIQQDKNKLGAEASNRLISELNKMLPTLKLGPVTIVDATVRSTTTAAHTINGMVEGIYGALTGTIEFIYDLTTNPEYRAQLRQSIEGAVRYLQDNHYSVVISDIQKKLPEVRDEIIREVKKVNGLPESQRAEAIGRLGGTIIGMLTGIRIGQVALGKVAEMGGKVGQAARISEKLAERGQTASDRARKVASASREALRAKYASMSIDAIINGVEGLVIGGVVKSFTTLKSTLTSTTASISEKFTAAKNTSQEVASELKKNISEGTKRVLEDLQGRLDAIMDKLGPTLRKTDEVPTQAPEPQRKNPIGETNEQNKNQSGPKNNTPLGGEGAPKSFESGANIDIKLLYRRLSQYYHTDRNKHPNAERLFKELSELNNELRGKKILQKGEIARDTGEVEKDIRTIARDPEGYIKSKDSGQTKPENTNTSNDKYFGMDKSFHDYYQDIGGDRALKQLLSKQDYEYLGQALLKKQELDAILRVAKSGNTKQAQEMFEFMRRDFDGYMSSQWNFEKMSDFYGVKDRLISAYMKQTGYNGDIPSEGFFRPRKTPESINILQGSVSQKVEDIMKMLGNNMEAFRGELLELGELIKGGAVKNFGKINVLINKLISDIGVYPSIALDLKAKIINNLRGILQGIRKEAANIPKGEHIHWDTQKTGINIKRNNGSITGLRGGTYTALKENDGTYTIKWREGDSEFTKNLSESEFRSTNNHLYEKDSTTEQPRQERGTVEFLTKDISNNLSDNGGKMYFDSRLPKPKYQATIQGREFIFTEALNLDNKTIVGYTLVNGKYESRYFYFSNSGGNWHCAPGVNSNGGHISKGEYWNPNGYTKETAVGNDLQTALSKIPTSNAYGNIDFSKIWHEHHGNLFNAKDSNQFSDFKNRERYTIGEGRGVIENMDQIRTISPDIDLSFSGGIRKGMSMNHARLGPTDTMIVTTRYRGRPIEVVFAWTQKEPDLVWVENIVAPGVGLDSFGIPRVMINGGGLTAKPIEYRDQVSNIFRGKSIDSDYVDMREYIQENPLVKRFKELTSLQKAA